MLNGLSLHLSILKKTPIPMYGVDIKHLKKYIIKSKKRLVDYLKKADNQNGSCAVVVGAEWYQNNLQYCHEMVAKYVPEWKQCEVYRDLHDVRIVAVIALKSNKKQSSRINKRVVDRAYKQKKPTICAYTRNELERDKATAEHIVPLSSGGNNSVWNICVADNDLNNRRGNMNFWKYWRSVLSSGL